MNGVEIVLLLGAIATAFIAIGKVTHTLFKEIADGWHKFKAVLDSYLGTPATDYFAARPGIPERMERSEKNLEQLVTEIVVIKQDVKEMKPIAEEAIMIGKDNAQALRLIDKDLKDGKEERDKIMKASNKMRNDWASALGVSIPDPPELSKYGEPDSE